MLRRGKKHPNRRPLKSNTVTLAQMMACPNKIMTAAHWVDVKPGEFCRCVTEMERISRVDER